MALDTRDKRAAAVGFLQPYRGVYPNPSGSSTASAGGRQQTARAYSGIAASVVVVTPTTPAVIIRGATFRTVRGSATMRNIRGDVPERNV